MMQSMSASMNDPPIPLVDLRRQYESIKDEIDAAVAGVLASGRYVLTEDVVAFEQEWAAYCRVRHCVGVASGTAALSLVFQAIGLEPGDEVILPANTYAGTVMPLLKTGVRPVLVDCDRYGLIDVAQAAACVGPRAKAIVGVDLYGHPCDADALAALAQEHNLTLVEDASQAHGARYRGRPCGSRGHVAAFSFYPTKNLGAYGEAGAVVTDDAALADTVRALGNLGQQRCHEHTLLGDNARLDALQAAVLRVKLRRLDRWVEQRRGHAERYAELLEGLVDVPSVAGWAAPSWHLYAIRTAERDSLQHALHEADVTTATTIHSRSTSSPRPRAWAI
jgi:dTDP-4-amino-4,6-dideoxygalactose transaminase